MPKMKTEKIEFPIKIREKVSFSFAHQSNAERVALALSLAGYYVRIDSQSLNYQVYVYTDREV